MRVKAASPQMGGYMHAKRLCCNAAGLFCSRREVLDRIACRHGKKRKWLGT